MKLVLALAMAAGCAYAQNSDLGLLLGISGPSASVEVSNNVRISSGSVGAHGQINYAAQLRETDAGRLYLELPLLLGGQASGTVSGTIRGSAGGAFFFTPGVRFNVVPHSRISFYGAVGAGPAAFDETRTVVGKGIVSTTTGWTVSAAFDFGGGLDLRLTRLMSLRGEVRDFVTGSGLGGAEGHHHPIFSFGVGFHW